jgi:hypothetical protein
MYAGRDGRRPQHDSRDERGSRYENAVRLGYRRQRRQSNDERQERRTWTVKTYSVAAAIIVAGASEL